MGYSLILIAIIILVIIVVALVSVQRLKEDPYKDLSIDEWNCPECGFLIQVGNSCIYCGYNNNNT